MSVVLPLVSEPEQFDGVPEQHALPSRVIASTLSTDDFFGHQPTSTASLPDPGPLIENLARCVIEILAGARDIEQIARWVTDDVSV